MTAPFVDLRDLENSEVVHVKLPRKKRFTRADIDKVDVGSKRIDTPTQTGSASSGVVVEKDLDDALFDGQEAGRKLRPVSSIEWGEFDIEKIIDLIIAIETLIVNIPTFPHPYQVEPQRRIIRSVLTGEGAWISILEARQSGKSYGVAGLLVTMGIVMPALARKFPEQLGHFATGFRMGIYAPIDEQAKTIYKYVDKFARSTTAYELYADIDLNTDIEKAGNAWENGSFVFCGSASKRAKIESKTYDLLILDECQDLDTYVIEKSLQPMVAYNNGTIVHVGTCTDIMPNFFKDLVQTNQLNDTYSSPEYQLHFEYNFEAIIVHNPRYETFISKYRNRPGGMDSRAFLLNFRLIWPDSDSLPIKKEELKRRVLRDTYAFKSYSNAPVVVAIDIAKKINSSIVYVSELVNMEIDYEDGHSTREVGLRVCDILELEQMDYPEQRGLIVSFLRPFTNIVYLACDATGVGDAVADYLAEELERVGTFERFLFSPKSKARIYDEFQEFYSRNRIIMPSDTEARVQSKWRRFFLQMVNVRKVFKNGYALLEKAETEGSRDDHVDALLLSCHAASMYSGATGLIEESPSTMGGVSRLHFRPNNTIPSPLFQSRAASVTIEQMRERRRDKIFKGV